MAFVATDPNQDENNPNAPGKANAMTAQPAPTTTSGGPAVSKSPTSNISNQVAGSASPAQPFQNIGAYLTANQPQAEQLGSTVAGSLTSKADQAEGAFNAASGSFDSAVKAGSPTLGQPQIETLENSPGKFVQNPGDVATFHALMSASPYSGPDAFTTQPGFLDLSEAANNGGALAKTLGDFNGIQSYLSTLTPNRTAGQDVLDTTLLQGTPSAAAPITAAAGRLNGLPTELNDLATRENAAAAGAKDSTARSADAARTASSTASKSVQDRIAKEISGATSSAQGGNSKVAGDLTSGKATPEELAQLGLSPADYQTLQSTLGTLMRDYGQSFDASPFVTSAAPGDDFGARTATADDYSDSAALASLLGGGFQSPLDPANAGLAGTAPQLLAKLNGDPTSAATAALKDKDQNWLDTNTLTRIANMFVGINGAAPTSSVADRAQAQDTIRRMVANGQLSTDLSPVYDILHANVLNPIGFGGIGGAK